MRRFIFYIFLCIGIAQAATQQNRPTPPLTIAERNKTLKELEDFLKKPTYKFPKVDLFAYKIENIVPKAKPVEKIPEPVRPSNEDIIVLRSIGKSIKPKGSLSTNDQFVLCIQGSRILKEGDILYARYRGMTYPIILKSVTRNQFTLEINGKEQTFQY